MASPADKRGWHGFLSERDRLSAEDYEGARVGLGEHPALLVVDLTNRFCGPPPGAPNAPHTGWRKAYADDAWGAVAKTADLVAAFRDKGLPVFFTTRQEPGEGAFFEGRWEDKKARGTRPARTAMDNLIVDQLRPEVHDIVIEKMKPSAFFGTPLTSYLIDLGVDSLVICGTATGGCVVATVLDAFSLNYRISVAEDATFDRYEASHWTTLFDIDTKYGDVCPSADLVGRLATMDAARLESRFRDLLAGQRQRAPLRESAAEGRLLPAD